MTIDEAINILEPMSRARNIYPKREEIKAIKLGIEALKSVRTGRRVGLHFDAKLLPGETKD